MTSFRVTPRTYHHEQQLDVFALLADPVNALQGESTLDAAPAAAAALAAREVALLEAVDAVLDASEGADERADDLTPPASPVTRAAPRRRVDGDEDLEPDDDGEASDRDADETDLGDEVEPPPPVETLPVFAKPTSPTWMHDVIRAFKAGDREAIAPLVDYYRHVFRRDARAMSVASNFRVSLDASDVESAGLEQLVAAADGFDPDAGRPFQAFFKQFRKAAVRSEKAAYMGPMWLSRRTITERGDVFRAVESVRAELRAKVNRTPLAVQRLPFRLPASEFTDTHARAIVDGTSGERRRAIARLIGVFAEYFTEVLTTTAPVSVETPDGPVTTDVTVRPDAVLIRRLAGAPLDRAQPLAWPSTRAELERMFIPTVATLLERLARDGEFTRMRRTADDPTFIVAVASKAGISEAQVKLHLQMDVHGTQLDAPVSGKDGKDAGTIGDRIGAVDADVTGDLIRAKAALAMPFMPLGCGQIFVAMVGLNGEPPMSQDEIGLAMGLVPDEVDRYVRDIVTTLRHPAVVERVHGTYAGHVARRVRAAEDLAAVMRVWPESPDAVEAAVELTARAEAIQDTPQRDIFDPGGGEEPPLRVEAAPPVAPVESLLPTPSYT